MGAKKVIGLCAPGMPKANVPSPLGAHQLLTLDSPADCTQLFAELGLLIENAELFASTARATAEKCSAAWLEDAGWKGLTHNDRYFAWEGPLEDLADWVDLPCPPGLIKSIESTGMVPSFEEPDKFRKLADQGYRRVFFTNRQTGKRPLTHQDGGRILMVRQKTEEEVQEELRKSALSIEWNNLLVELEKLSQPLGISSESRPESSVSGEKVCWSGVVVTSERHEAITVTLMKKPDGAITEAVKGVHKINFSHRCDFVQSRAGGGYAWRVNRISDSQASVSSFSGDTCMFAAWLTREIQRLAEQERDNELWELEVERRRQENKERDLELERQRLENERQLREKEADLALKRANEQVRIQREQAELECQRAAKGLCTMCGMPLSIWSRNSEGSRHRWCFWFQREAHHSPFSLRVHVLGWSWKAWTMFGIVIPLLLALVAGIVLILLFACRSIAGSVLHVNAVMLAGAVILHAFYGYVFFKIDPFEGDVLSARATFSGLVGFYGLIIFANGVIAMAVGDKQAVEKTLKFPPIYLAVAGAAILSIFAVLFIAFDDIHAEISKKLRETPSA